MRPWLSIASAVALAGAGVGYWRQARSLRVLHASLEGTAVGGADWSEKQLDSLPEPVQRYLRLVLPAGLHAPKMVRLRQEGQLRTSTSAKRWMSFVAEHAATPNSAGFLWDATVRVAPAVHVRVVDSLIAGCGAGSVSLMSTLPVAHDGGTHEMHSGTLHRYLAEAVPYPWALLPSNRLTWTPITDTAATATLGDGAASVALEFSFAPTGEIVGMYTPGRWGRFDGAYAKVPWEAHVGRYETHGGTLVPTQAEVGWHAGGRLEVVWKASVVADALT